MSGMWFYLILRKRTIGRMWIERRDMRGGVSGCLGRPDERSLYRNGEADELCEGVVAEVRDPDVAAGVDGDGEGLEHVGVGRPAGCGREGLARTGGCGAGKLGEGGSAEVGDPDGA